MKHIIKSIMSIILILALTITIFTVNGYCASAYKKTSYQTYSDVIESIPTDFNSLRYAKTKLKSRYGKKTILVVCIDGIAADLTKTQLFVKSGNTIYQYGDFHGVITHISKNRKYLYVGRSSASKSIYKYNSKKQKYVKYKTILEPKPKDIEKLRKEYKCNIELKYKTK